MPTDTQTASPERSHPMDVLRKFRIVVGAVRRHTRDLERACGIAGAQVWMLAAIVETPGITVSALSRALSIHVSTASNLIERLVQRGLVERLRCEDDRRAVRVRVTTEGKSVLANAPQPLRGLLLDALSRLPADTLSRLDGDLDCLIAHLNGGADVDAANEPL